MKRRHTLGNPPWWDPRNTRAMLVCRISDRKQKDGVSLDAQQHLQERYARDVGLTVAAVASFQESAKKSTLRSQFHAAIAKARAQGVKHLVFYVWDRIARNFTDAEILEEMVRDGEIVIHIACGGTVLHEDSDDSEFFLFDINIAQAKQDNRARKRKTIDGMEQRCRNGWYPSRPPAFYWQEPDLDEHGRPKKRGSTVAGPTPEGRRLVRREMELHLKGFSLDRIRETCLAERLVPPNMIASYYRTTVEKHLKQDFYAGIPNPHDGFKSQFTWRDTWYEAKHEPIFTAEEWRRLQASFGKQGTYRKLKHEGLFNQGPLSLTCAAPGCGCKITFAPKTKGTGEHTREYRYYRCADGKRVHVDGGERQVNVREEDILDALGEAVERIAIDDFIAEAIAHALNVTHREAKAARSKAAETYRAELQALDQKENTLVDVLTSGNIDAETFSRQQRRVRAERDALFDKLREADAMIDDGYLVTAHRVLELAKSARTLWNGRSAQEKCELLEKLVCNPRLEGRTVRYDLQKSFAALAQMRGEEGWRPRRDSNPC